MTGKSTILYGVMLGIVLCFCGCFSGKEKKMNERVTFWHKDKNPYGTWYAYEELSYLFPLAAIVDEKESPGYKDGYAYSELHHLVNKQLVDSGKALLVIIAPSVTPDSNEIAALKNFVEHGNFLLISALHFGDALCDSLQIHMADENDGSFGMDSMTLDILHPFDSQAVRYSYPGFGMHSYFDRYDSSQMKVLGRNKSNLPTLLATGDSMNGRLMLNSMPFALGNFFLLHKNNKSYYDLLFSHFPGNISVVVWDDYFRRPGNRGNFSSLGVILANRSLRWTLYLALFGAALLLFSELKRRQRAVPVIQPLTNSTVDFVKTVGRLYFQVRNNNDLAEKMVAHFKENVRSRFGLDCTVLDDHFIELLSHKSGMDKAAIEKVIAQVLAVSQGNKISEDDLMLLHEKLDSFYKK